MTPGISLPRLQGRAFLAPMAGVSDPALRLLAKRNGAALVVTEFTSIHGIVAHHTRLKSRGDTIRRFLEYSDEERPLSVQIFGSDIDMLQRAARIVEPYFDVIDYNMGCPAPHITRQMAGSALLSEESLTRRILQTLVESVSVPVTLKMRCGVDDTDRYRFLRIADIAQDAGVSMITLHPRTAYQGYAGKSDWSLIRLLKSRVRIPVTGNGDIRTPEDADRMIKETGCDYVMVGRGAMGNPFLFSQINDYLRCGSYRHHTIHDRLWAFFEYMGLASRFDIKLWALKSQAMRFIRGAPQASRMRKSITAAQNAADLAETVRALC